jgi:hypothetical protein
MKINEVLEEGVLGTLGSMAGAVAGGVAKGLGDVVAPGATDQMKGVLNKAKQQAGYNDIRKTAAYGAAKDEQALTNDPKIKAALDKTLADAVNLIKQRQATAQTAPAAKSSFSNWSKSQVAEAEETAPAISLAEIQKLLAKNGAPAEGAEYVASRLAQSGVRVAGYQAPAGTMANTVSKDNRIVDVLIQRAKQNKKSSMAEIAKAIPQTGLYADKAKRDAKIKEIAKKISELNIPVAGYQLQAQPDQWSWDSSSSKLTATGASGTYTYRRFQDGSWRDDHTGEKIKSPRDKELQTQYDKLTGRVAYPGGRPKAQGLQPNQVKVKSGEIITKNSDGRWYDTQGNYISDPNDLKELERRYAVNRQTAAMAQTQVPPGTTA